jgi:hypothetical protein
MGLWSLLRIVRQGSLLSCRLEFEDRSLERASLFPLFDDEGRTRMLMITAEENGRIMLTEWTPGLFERDWRWRNRLRLRFADLNDASMWDEGAGPRERFEELWHFDPRWVLGDERYHGHGAVPALRSTNIPGYEPTISGLGFDASLGRATYMVKRSSESVSAGRFNADTLAAAATRRRAAHVRPRSAATDGWQLRPFWRFP